MQWKRGQWEWWCGLTILELWRERRMLAHLASCRAMRELAESLSHSMHVHACSCTRNWRDGSVILAAYRRPELSSQHPCQTAHDSLKLQLQADQEYTLLAFVGTYVHMDIPLPTHTPMHARTRRKMVDRNTAFGPLCCEVLHRSTLTALQ